jgi:hypothetical protein
MKDFNKRYVRTMLVCFCVLLAGYMATAVILDPFKVFGITKLNERNMEPNTRYLKIEHLKKHNDYRGFVFGNSRSNAFRTDLLSELTGLKFYNMNAQSDTPSKILLKLRWLVANQKVEAIMIGLDFDDVSRPIVRNLSILQEREHPAVRGESMTAFQYSYLWPNFRHLAITAYGNFFASETWYRFDSSQGRHDFPYYRAWMKKDPVEYIANRLVPFERRDHVPNSKQMQKLQETVELARRHSIKTTIIVNPTSHRLFLSWRSGIYVRWLGQVANIAGQVWDFSGLNCVTRNDRNYYDISHFTEEVGDKVLRQIFKNNSGRSASMCDFGVLLTRDNIM